MKPLPTCRRLAATLVLTLLGLGACGRSDQPGGDVDDAAAFRSAEEVGVVGMKTGVTRQQYLAMPDSVRLESEKDDPSRGEAQGVTVEVFVRLDGHKGEKVPLDYTLHDARNSLPFVSRRVAMEPDAPEWSRRSHVWLPVPAAGTYYVQFVLGDSTGHKASGPRTLDFTVR